MRKLTIVLGLFLVSTQLLANDLLVTDLRAEYKTDPLGLDVVKPRLGWRIETQTRGILQSAYQILVADDASLLAKNKGNVWDSGKQLSSTSVQAPYGGAALAAGKIYYWKVKIWDNRNRESGWSAVSKWQMGLLHQSDWKGAKWIAYEKLPDSLLNVLPDDTFKDKTTNNNILPIIRKDFTVKKELKYATMFISGLGHFELSVNGNKVGDHILDPGWTKYDKQALYVTFDVTSQLNKGENALGVMLGNGFYYIPPVKGRYRKQKVAFGFPKMICRLQMEYTDGTTENVISDQTWKATAGPITFSSIYGGEDYDARLEQKGWDSPGFNDKSWRDVVLVDGPPMLSSQMAEPVKVMETFVGKDPVSPGTDAWVYDLGQNASGIVSIKVKGKKGDTIRIRPAELLREDGFANQKATGSPYYFQYILKGDGEEEWQPRFSYYGFRYVQVEGAVPEGKANAASKPVLKDLKGLHIRNSAPRNGHFSSSNELFNRTNTLIDWGMKSNMVSVFTDCPHREKLGWLEQTHLVGSSVRFNYDISNLSRKAVTDMSCSQTEDGLIPAIAPEYVNFSYGGGVFRDSPEWGSAGIILPWYLYQWYGDRRPIEEAYPMMQRYVEQQKKRALNNILEHGLGDWFDLGPERPGFAQMTPMGVTGTATFYYDLNIMREIATMLGKPADAARYKSYAAEVKDAFNKTFFNEETRQYANGSQTSNAMAVYMKLVDEKYKDDVVNNLIKDIRARNNGLTAGDVGYRYVLRVLEAEGRSDVIYDMNSRSDVPGYGMQLAKGATALTESWMALPTVSNNHFMLGHLMEWFYSGLAGIRAAEGSVAFNHAVIHPEPVADVSFVCADYMSPYGKIVSDWKKGGDSFELKVEVPANTRATVYLPASEDDKIFEGGKTKQTDWKIKAYEKGRAVIEVGSGSYSFEVKHKR